MASRPGTCMRTLNVSTQNTYMQDIQGDIAMPMPRCTAAVMVALALVNYALSAADSSRGTLHNLRGGR